MIKTTDKWKKFLVIWGVFLIVAGAVLCIVLYKYLAAYEITRPETVMDRMLEEYRPSDWYDAARKNPDLAVNGFEDPVRIYNSFLDNSRLDDSSVTYYKDSSKSGDGKAVFVIRSGSTPVAEVTLLHDKTKPHGFEKYEWKLEKVTAPDILKYLKPVDVTILTPQNYEVVCNGKKVDSSYITDKNAVINTGNKFEDGTDIQERVCRYSLGKMYGEISVEDTAGRELAAEENGETVTYTKYRDNSYSVKICVPEDVTVTINGIEADRSEGTVDNSLFEDIEDYTRGNEYNMIVYKYHGFSRLPEVVAKDNNGNILRPLKSKEGCYFYMYKNDPDCQNTYESIAKAFFNRYTAYLTTKYDDDKRKVLLGSCLENSKVYNYISDATDALKWRKNAQIISSDVRFDNFSMVGDSCFVCSVEYTFNQAGDGINSKNDTILTNAYRLVFVHTSYNNRWVCAKMEPTS